jgi:cation/acetate symporter
MSAAFLLGIATSLAAREPAAEGKFDSEKLRAYLGVGSE